jgi:diguanylate cyclase (GGDEF)-like protein
MGKSGLDNRLRELRIALHSCVEQEGRGNLVAALRRSLAALSEAAGAFGRADIERRAGQASALVDAFLAGGGAPGSDIATLADRVQRLLYDSVVPATPATPAAPRAPTVRREEKSSQRAGGPSSKTICLVSDNPLLARDTALQLQCFGYQVTVLTDRGTLAASIENQAPGCVLIDAGNESAFGKADMALIRASAGLQVPILQLSTRSHFEARLAAVRAGVNGYFVKPLDIVALIDRLDALTVRRDRRPYRILMVGNDVERQEARRHALAEAGMEVLCLQQPIDLFSTLSQHRPELVVIDVDSPECSGADLAALIRQDKTWLDLPIVLLSQDDETALRRDAIAAGADDFLLRPGASELVFSVSGRVERYRALRGLIMRDGLTGLYNHSATKEHLMREVARSRRDGQPLSLAMVDIDFFKKVNDTYGHPVGDQVIRAIARLLQHRLRHGDVVGRYGGEEFAVILPATSAVTAQRVMDEIRAAFQLIRHKAGDGEFGATFSAGVAELTDAEDAGALFRVADIALYRAKHGGRNRVEMAERATETECEGLPAS